MTAQQTIFLSKVLPVVTARGAVVSRKDLKAACQGAGISVPSIAKQTRAARGMFDLSHLLNGSFGAVTPIAPIQDTRTDKEIEQDIDDRFAAVDRMVTGLSTGDFRSVILSGNPGTGKTYTSEYILEGAAHDGKIMLTAVRGYVKPTGMYRLLWEARHENCVLMFDDADSVFDDEIGLNLLKGALDTTKRRTISWRSEKVFECEDGEQIPNSFDFKGSVLFITNLNFDHLINRNSKLSPHLAALQSRSFYLDVNLDFPRELMVRIKSVVLKSSILDHLTAAQRGDVLDYMTENMKQLRELSLRMALKLGSIIRSSKNNADFERMARATCLKLR